MQANSWVEKAYIEKSERRNKHDKEKGFVLTASRETEVSANVREKYVLEQARQAGIDEYYLAIIQGSLTQEETIAFLESFLAV